MLMYLTVIWVLHNPPDVSFITEMKPIHVETIKMDNIKRKLL